MMTMRALVASRPVSIGPAIAFASAAAYVGVFAWAMEHTSYDIWPAMFVGPLLAAVTLPVMLRTARREHDDVLLRWAPFAMFMKLAGTLTRYVVIYTVYGGGSDASSYHDAGRLLSDAIRSGDQSIDIGRGIPGTGFIRLLTGVIYTGTGATKLSAFLIYSWFCFVGMYLFYRAVRIAFPEADHRRYFVLIFFAPSLLFWPSSIGKDAWMILTLGMIAYGGAALLSRRWWGIIPAVLGLAGAGAVRPHIMGIAFVSLVVAFLLRRPARRTATAPLAKAVGMVCLVLGAVVVLGRVQSFLNLESLDTESIEVALNATAEQTTQQGSSFDAPTATNPALYPVAVFTVLFRPLPFETNDALSLMTSLEGLVLLGLFVSAFPRLALLRRHMVERPYVAYALFYVLVFCFAFSSIGNFGILARQRSQVLPLFFVLLSLPRPVVDPRITWARRPNWQRKRREAGSAAVIDAPAHAP